MGSLSRGIRALLLCVVVSGMVSDVLAQTITVASSRRTLNRGRPYPFTCGSPLTVSSPTNDGRSLRISFMNTDRSQVVIDAVSATQVDTGLKLIKCLCFKPEKGFYNLSFFDVSERWESSYGVTSAADFIRENRSVCVP
jgi:hypothetical protein